MSFLNLKRTKHLRYISPDPYNEWVSRSYFVLAILLFIGFVFFSYIVSQELFVQFDFDTTVKIQNRINRSLDGPFSILSLLGTLEITGLVWFILTVLILLRGWIKTAFLMALLPISQVLELFGKIFLLHPSPPFLFFRGTLPFNFPSAYIHTDYSYPSGHTIRTSFLVVFIWFWLERRFSGPVKFIIQTVLILFLLAMFISRIYLGEHWATDVIGGAMLGLSMGIIVGLAVPKKSSVNA